MEHETRVKAPPTDPSAGCTGGKLGKGHGILPFLPANYLPRGRNRAVVALVREILGVLWHLLMNQGRYVESGLKKSGKLPVSLAMLEMSINEVVAVVLNARYRVYTHEKMSRVWKWVRE